MTTSVHAQLVPPDGVADGSMLRAQADAAWFALDFDAPAAAQQAERLLAAAELSHDAVLEAAALCVLAWHRGSQFQMLDEALRWAQRALAAASADGARMLRPRAHSAMAMVLGALGDRAARFEHLEAMRQASIELGDTYHEVLALHDLGLDFDQPELLERALALAETLPRPGMCVISNLLHTVAQRLRCGDLATALARSERAWQLACTTDSPRWRIEALRILAVTQAKSGHRASSLESLHRLQASAPRPGLVRLTRARVYAALGWPKRAIAAYEECLECDDQPRLLHDAARELAPLLARARRWQRAYDCQVRIETLRCRLQQDDNERRLRGLEVQHRLAIQEQQTQQEQARNRELARHVAQLEALNREITELSIRDALTGLFNRRHADAELARALSRVERGDDMLAVALMDIDHFKSVNDRFGHAVGDEVLRQVASLVAAQLRDADLVARYGGEEFVLLLPGATRESAYLACERMRRMVEGHDWETIAAGLRITVSLGQAQAAPGQTAHAVLQTADACLYRAKAEGRNRVVDSIPQTPP